MSGSTSAQGKILVVDDSADNLGFFKKALEDQGMKVTTAGNGEEALATLHKTRVDLIVSSTVMPVMDGFHFLQECKADPSLHKIPFIFVTGAFLDKKYEELASKIGISAFIRKPVESTDLIRTVDRVLAAAKSKKRGRKPKAGKASSEKQFNVKLLEKLKAKMEDMEAEAGEHGRTETALSQAEEQYRLLLDTMAQGVVFQDADGRIISANRAAEKILGLSRDQLLGRTSYDPRWRAIKEDGADFPGDLHPAIVALMTGKPVKDMVMGVFAPAENKFHWINVDAMPQFRPGEETPYQVCTTFQDTTDRFLTFKALQENESRLHAILENTPDAILSLDRDYRLIAANRAADRLYSMVAGPLCPGQNILESMPPEQQSIWDNILRRVLGGEYITFENHYDTDEGSFDIEYSVNPILSPPGNVTGVSMFGREITERKRSEKSLSESNRLHKMLFFCNEAVVHADSEQQLLDDICRVMVETGGYRMAWVGHPEQDELKTVRPVASYGFEEGYLNSAAISWAEEDERGNGPTGMAIREGATIVNRDALLNPDFAPWLEAAKMLGYGGSVALPLKSYGQVIGALNVYASAPNAFGADEIKLLEQLAADLSYGIAALHERKQREEAEEALQLSEQRFRKAIQSTTDIVWDCDINSGQVDWYGDIDRMLGYEAGEFCRTLDAWESSLHPDDHDRVTAAFNRHVQTGEPYNVEYRILSKDGAVRIWITRGMVIRDRNGEITRSVGACVDITEHRLSDQRIMTRRDLAIAIASSTDIASIAKHAVDAARKISGMEAGAIFILDEKTGDYLAVLQEGYSPAWDERFCRVKADSENAIMIHAGKPAYLRVENMPSPFNEQFTAEKLTYSATVPVVYEGKSIACLVTSSYTLKDLPGEIRRSLEHTASDIGMAIQRVRSIEALKASEVRYRFIADNTVDVIWALDKNLKFTYFSPSVRRQRGFTVAEITERSVEQVIAPSSLEPVFDAVIGALDRLKENPGGPVMFIMNMEIYRADGSTIWTETSFTVIGDAGGNLESILGISRDITERRQFEAQLKQSEEKYRNLIEVTYDTIAVAQEGKIKFFNRRATELTGYSSGELYDMPITDLVYEEDRDMIADRYRGRLAGGPKESTYSFRYITKDGTVGWAEINVALIEWDGRPATLSSIRDITARKRADDALMESEEKYRALVENAGEAIVVAQDGLLKFSNSRAIEILGYPTEEMKNMPFARIIHPDDLDMVAKRHVARLQGEDIEQVYDFRMFTREGNTRWVEIHAVVINWESKPATLNFLADITERKAAEDAIKHSEENYRLLIENAREGIVIIQDRIVKFVNRDISELLGYPKEEILSRPFIDFIHPDDKDMVMKTHVRRLRGEVVPDLYSFRSIRQSGEAVWMELRAITVDWEGNPATLNFIRDISERRRFEATLHESEEKFRRLFDQSPVGVAIVSPEDSRFTSVNESLCNILGYSSDELVKLRFADITHQDDLSRDREQVTRLASGEIEQYVTDKRYIRKDGSVVWGHLCLRLIKNAEGSALYFLPIIENISDRKRAEEELKQALDAITSTLEGSMEAIATMSELRDPYTAGHQRMVTKLAIAIATEMGLSDEQLHGLRVAGLLHDVGKVYVPSEILSRPGRLSELEKGLVKSHAEAGYNIVKTIKFPWPVNTIIRQHHERIDGSGYPGGVKGEAIMLEARILAVADVVEAMMSHRPYRPALGVDRALNEITSNRGILYDEKTVDICVSLFREKGFRFTQ